MSIHTAAAVQRGAFVGLVSRCPAEVSTGLEEGSVAIHETAVKIRPLRPLVRGAVVRPAGLRRGHVAPQLVPFRARLVPQQRRAPLGRDLAREHAPHVQPEPDRKPQEDRRGAGPFRRHRAGAPVARDRAGGLLGGAEVQQQEGVVRHARVGIRELLPRARRRAARLGAGAGAGAAGSGGVGVEAAAPTAHAEGQRPPRGHRPFLLLRLLLVFQELEE